MYSLHPITVDEVRLFLELIQSGTAHEPGLASARSGFARMDRGDMSGANEVTFGLAEFLGSRDHTFFTGDIGLSGWEASIDRGLGMSLRPPARALVEAGLERSTALEFPIRIDAHSGPMGGAWIPPSLIPSLIESIEGRLDRHMKRLHEADLDPVLTLGTMLVALKHARSVAAGLYEAKYLVHPGYDAGPVVAFSRRKDLPAELRDRLETAHRNATRKPGLASKLLGRKRTLGEAAIHDDWYADTVENRSPD